MVKVIYPNMSFDEVLGDVVQAEGARSLYKVDLGYLDLDGSRSKPKFFFFFFLRFFHGF